MQNLAALIVASFLQPACVTNAMTSKCTVNGALGAMPGMSADAVCDNFNRDLAKSLGARRVPDGLLVALTLHKRGAINAQFSRVENGETVTYPVVTVDAMDRALRAEDLGRLAQAAAQMLLTDGSDNWNSRTVTSKGE